MSAPTIVTMTDAEHFVYRWGGDQLPRDMYDATENVSTAELVERIHRMQPDFGTHEDHVFLPLQNDRDMLACYVARVYERMGAASIELEYAGRLHETYETAKKNAPHGATDEQLDEEYELLPYVPYPAQIAVQRAVRAVAAAS